MSVLQWIVLASFAGGALSAGMAAFALLVRAAWVQTLVSFAIGALLGAAFLEVIPHAFAHGEAHEVAGAILGGILVFFLLEKLLLWRHSHDVEDEEHEPGESAGDAHAHGHGHVRAGALIVVGDTIHNFLDGILIAAAFLQSTQLGVVTALAIVAHEIPQEVGDFLILLHSGYGKARAFLLNLLSSLMMVIGAVGAYFALQLVQGWVNTMLALAAASMIYVAVADLIPGLHKRPELAATAQQVLLILLGIASVWIVGEVAHGQAH